MSNGWMLTLEALAADVLQSQSIRFGQMIEELVGGPGPDHLVHRQERFEYHL